jgi:hypothetical protein
MPPHNPLLLIALVFAATVVTTWAVVNTLFWLTNHFHDQGNV